LSPFIVSANTGIPIFRNVMDRVKAVIYVVFRKGVRKGESEVVV
jgi:hypothetical protein